MSTNLSDWLHIRWPDGREGHVLPADLADKKKADNFDGVRILGNADGTEYTGPTTADGMLRKAEREAEERAKARTERAAPVAKDDEPKAAPAVREADGKG